MLIVNADDFGASRSTTDPIAECFAEGVITSTSAMVWMRDSDRAAALAVDCGFATGLHINFTHPFDGDTVPDAVRQRQLGFTRVLRPDSWRSHHDLGAAGSVVAEAIADQLSRFRDTFGEPTHIDGHHHIHLHPAVLAELPRDLPIRPPLQSSGRQSFRQRRLLLRFQTPSACIAFEHLHPALGGVGVAALGDTRRRTVEVMTHPISARERDALLSPEWRAAIAGVALGSYRDLQRR